MNKVGGDGSKWQGKVVPSEMYSMLKQIWPQEEPFVIWKLSEGIYADPTGVLNALNSKDAGFQFIGGYHFWATNVGWKLQAERYLKEWDKIALQVAPELDLEGAAGYPLPNSRYQDELLLWIDFVEPRTGVETTIYSNRDWITRFVNRTVFRTKPLHIAAWNVNAPTIPKPWLPGTWAIWQTGVFDASGMGVSSKTIDMNVAQYLPIGR